MIDFPKSVTIGTAKCKRCKEFFFPSTPKQIYCPYCQGKSYPLNKVACKVTECKELVGRKGAKGLCPKHYAQLIRHPKEASIKASRRAGAKICETYKKCKIFFYPGKSSHQKYCDFCKMRKKNIYTK